MAAVTDSPGAVAPSRQRYRVAIIGGGLAGCACALALAQHGVYDVLVIEAGDYAQFRIGESIPPEANRLFQALGIAQEFFAEAHAPCHGSCSWWGSDKRGYNDALLHPLGHGWHLERSASMASWRARRTCAGRKCCCAPAWPRRPRRKAAALPWN